MLALVIALPSCGGGASLESKANPLSIQVSGLVNNNFSYMPQSITVESNYPNCGYKLSQNDQSPKILHTKTSNDKDFIFRNPILYEATSDITLTISTISSPDCPAGFKDIHFSIQRYPTDFSVEPRNPANLNTRVFQVSDIGFGGLVITDRYTATICYPTPDDCEPITDQLFGQDAHNMTAGDFNGDGHEDLLVAWAIFPHTIEESQKINAPINIYLNNGQGRFAEDLTIYAAGHPPTHPFAYRVVVEDFNGDGIDDVFAGSMGIQVRSPNHEEDYIDPYPHLLLLSDQNGQLVEAKENIESNNSQADSLCSFAHDASAGDVDGDHDIDIFACNVLLINDGAGNFHVHQYINQDWRSANQYGNPMSSLVKDLNNDGFDDLLFWSFDNRSSWSSADEGYILLSDHTAQIENWEQIPLPVGPFGYDHNKYNHATSGDLNGDGHMDVAVAITRDIPYYEGSYIQILINDGTGQLDDQTDSRFPNQARADSHHGEGNIYANDFNMDGHIDIIHSTRDYQSGYHGVNIAINNGDGSFTSLAESDLPMRPRELDLNSLITQGDYNYLTKGLPINADNEACLDLISATEVGLGDPPATRNYLFSIISKSCDF